MNLACHTLLSTTFFAHFGKYVFYFTLRIVSISVEENGHLVLGGRLVSVTLLLPPVIFQRCFSLAPQLKITNLVILVMLGGANLIRNPL